MMMKWFFPSMGYGAIEGFSNPGLEMFKGEPIKAMAREIIQNSLDAVNNLDKPVYIEFENSYRKLSDFPGIESMREIIGKCREFWRGQNDEKTMKFIAEADKRLNSSGIFVLRVSDYNTTGVKGAFSSENEITPWKSLVQGNAFSVKNSDSAGGSYGIGKAAPFVVSKLQTVFYRTYDTDGVKAAQGVTHLTSFSDPSMALPGEDSRRCSTGYYSINNQNVPFEVIDELEKINVRTEYGTDLFIPAFDFASGKNDWTDDIIIEILDNFLYAIYSEKLVVKVDKKRVDKVSLARHIDRLMPKTKHASYFYNVIREDNNDVIEEKYKLYSYGYLRLRLLYKSDLNKKVLVVRNSGMKITDIKGLPKGISYTGFLELQGESVNEFFRRMENPQHNMWEPERHEDPQLAKKLKKEVEGWVKDTIGRKIEEISGAEMDIDVGSIFNTSENINYNSISDVNKKENVTDTIESVSLVEQERKDNTLKIKDIGEQSEETDKKMISGFIDDSGNSIGHRHRSGGKREASPTGRRGYLSEKGPDKMYDNSTSSIKNGGKREVEVSARFISKKEGLNRLILIAKEDINTGEIEIVSTGENGKILPIYVDIAMGLNVECEALDGHIKIKNVKANDKVKIDFYIKGGKNYAMGVRAYGN